MDFIYLNIFDYFTVLILYMLPFLPVLFSLYDSASLRLIFHLMTKYLCFDELT